jgi:hypothetical protein
MLGIIKAAGKPPHKKWGWQVAPPGPGGKIVENTAKILVICVPKRGLEYEYAAAY